jgi:hypothetical protein
MVKTIRQNEVVEFAFVFKKDFLETNFLVQGIANVVFYFVIKKMEHLCRLQSVGHSHHHTHYSQQVSVCHLACGMTLTKYSQFLLISLVQSA